MEYMLQYREKFEKIVVNLRNFSNIFSKDKIRNEITIIRR